MKFLLINHCAEGWKESRLKECFFFPLELLIAVSVESHVRTCWCATAADFWCTAVD